ncbi:sugar transferase [Xylanibacillus composti]|nr:sugar transferase [Xylanibacillus composti]MDT9724512.1 sugar transferase [Xylanibacillus composti]
MDRQDRLIVKSTVSVQEARPRLPRASQIYVDAKRVFDCLIAVIGLTLSMPIMILFSILIKLESPGPILFAQERVGLHGKVFRIYKLRSMVKDAEKNGAKWAEKNDARITKIGKFIRNTRIDELPQFINVLKGDMSFIGPRPERPVFVEQFAREIPGFKDRQQVKPGITGWAQVNGGYDITPQQKLALDLEYIEHFSFWMDVKIILKTVKVVITGDGAR